MRHCLETTETPTLNEPNEPNEPEPYPIHYYEPDIVLDQIPENVIEIPNEVVIREQPTLRRSSRIPKPVIRYPN